MRYYVLFRSDGVSAEGDMGYNAAKYYDTLEEAVGAAQRIFEADQIRSADEYCIRGIEPDTFPEESTDYDIYGNEI